MNVLSLILLGSGMVGVGESQRGEVVLTSGAANSDVGDDGEMQPTK